jgi:hypothetical protein
MSDCSICLNPLNNENGPSLMGNWPVGWGRAYSVIQTSCGHLFHRQCIISWGLRQEQRGEHESCPLCRNVFPNNEAATFATAPQINIGGRTNKRKNTNKRKKTNKKRKGTKRRR